MTVKLQSKLFTRWLSADVSQLKYRNVDIIRTDTLQETQAIGGEINIDGSKKPSECSTLRSPTKYAGGCYLPETSDDSGDCDGPFKSPVPRSTMPLEKAPVNELLCIGRAKESHPSHIRIETSVSPLHSCDRYCLCQCHKVTNLATPNNYTDVIGRLFVGYVGLPLLSPQKCNRISCRQGRTQARFRIAYLFPVWFALRLIALTITKASTTFMWTLSFPVVTQTATPVVIYVSLGDMNKVHSLLASKEGTINTIDAVASKSPLHVSNSA